MGDPQEGLWRPPRGPQMASEDLWRPQLPETAQEGPRTAQEGPRTAQTSPPKAQTAFSYELTRRS
eukprot:1658971-Pyramimonas_sp.AAC.1